MTLPSTRDPGEYNEENAKINPMNEAFIEGFDTATYEIADAFTTYIQEIKKSKKLTSAEKKNRKEIAKKLFKFISKYIENSRNEIIISMIDEIEKEISCDDCPNDTMKKIIENECDACDDKDCENCDLCNKPKICQIHISINENPENEQQ